MNFMSTIQHFFKRINRRILAIIGISLAGLFALFFLGFLVSHLVSLIHDQDVAQTTNNDESLVQNDFSVSDASTPYPDPQEAAKFIFPEDLVIPDEIAYFWRPGWRLSREVRAQWSLEDISEFWQDPLTIGTETLSQENRSRYRDMLMEID